MFGESHQSSYDMGLKYLREGLRQYPKQSFSIFYVDLTSVLTWRDFSEHVPAKSSGEAIGEKYWQMQVFSVAIYSI